MVGDANVKFPVSTAKPDAGIIGVLNIVLSVVWYKL